jgi:TetR/AcrR family transcriptional regulator
LSADLPNGKYSYAQMPSQVTTPTSDMRAQIVAAATRLFARSGFDGTAVQDIADAVGVSKQAVLHHFATKESVRRAVLDAIVSHWNQKIPELLVATGASEDRFDAVLGELHRFFAQAPDRARLVLREALDRPQEVKALLAGPVRPWLVAIARYIQAGQSSGRHYADADAEAYVIHVLQLVLVAAASSELFTPLLGEHGNARYESELARLAKAGLFDMRSHYERKAHRAKR